MLHFFRKYQKFFFFIVAAVIIFSFAFSGAFSSYLNRSAPSVKKIGKTITGEGITDRQFAILTHLLSYGQDCIASSHEERTPFLFNEGVFLKDFVETGYAKDILTSYEAVFKEEIQERIQLAKAFIPFVHSKVSFIKEIEVWKRYNPELYQHFLALKEVDPSDTKASFQILLDLFQDQQRLPSGMVKKLLYFQQGQYSQLAQDEEIVRRDFSLFGFHTIEDWFGKKFTEAFASFILNGSSLAKQKGITCERAEVKETLLSNVKNCFLQYGDKKQITDSAIKKVYLDQRDGLGLTERELTDAWKSVLLFQKYLKAREDRVFMDSLSSQTFKDFTESAVEVDTYSLPQALQFKSFQDLVEFEAYYERVFAKGDSPFRGEVLSLEEMKKKAPELIYRQYEIEYTEIELDKLEEKIALRDVMNWQLEEANWQQLSQKYPYIVPKEEQDTEKRLELLSNLSLSHKEKLDRVAKEAIIEAHPEWMEEALGLAAFKKEVVSIPLKATSFPLFIGVKESEAVFQLLDRLYENKESEIVSFDKKHYYKVGVKERGSDWEKMDFAFAKKERVLQKLVEKKLEAAYPEIRKKNAARFQKAEGVWKSVSEAKYDLFPIVYSELIKKLVHNAKLTKAMLDFDSVSLPLDLLARYRFYSTFSEEREDVLEGKWEKEEGREFNLVTTREMLLRKNYKENQPLFEEKEGYLSPLYVAKNGNLEFVQLLRHTENKSRISSLPRVREALLLEVQTQAFKELLSKMSRDRLFTLEIEHE